jgi:methionyl-tRNA synthetase
MRVSTLVEKNLEGLVDLDTWSPTLPEFMSSSKVQEVEIEEETVNIDKNGDETEVTQTKIQKVIGPIPFDFSPAYAHLYQLKPKEALDVVLSGANFGNELLEKTKPWTRAKEGKIEEVREILTGLCILLRDLGEILSIFLPASGDKIYQIFTSEKIVKAEVLFQKYDFELDKK